MCCVHSFFLKPLSVTLPFAARFTGREAGSRARQRIQKLGERKNRDSGRTRRGEPLARFLKSPQTIG